MKILNLIVVTLFCSSVFAQTTLTKKQQLEALPNTVENQFIKTYGKASNWKEYKMITRPDFQSLQKNVVDSLVALKKNIQVKQLKINEQEKSISTLNEKINGLTNSLNSSIDKENKISFIGIGMTKSSYNLLLWTVIAFLAITAVFFILRFKNSNRLTKEAKVNLTEIEQEFEQHRKRSLEKEQKLRRQLQDEINKQRGV
ncbi:hypothetical protein BTO06_02655 [Tenacibaculum sp. SZ-18]|uniref:hypothetical protein n=1 Tax=Tenacibaculum sp. SZ-18 TaxID=754423 RepID=UPI000C2D5071|nr:hypothetical protein [Tenacibaculum sp. SZ-18]AUC14125.1 hypothetical protein BTO06_02655 [Tenacibaculum sp. SZ-18]